MQPPELYRTRLRTAVTKLLSELQAFHGHVYNMRTPVMRRDMLPAVRVFTLQDSRVNSAAAHDIGVLDGTLTLRIQVIVEQPADPKLSDNLDWHCWLAETALLSDPKVRRELRCINSIDTSIDLDVQGEMRTATATMDYDVRYNDCFELVLPDELRTLHFNLDFIDPPADPNTGPPGTPPNVEGGYPGGYPGPDGRIENQFEVTFPTDAQDDPPELTAAQPPTSESSRRRAASRKARDAARQERDPDDQA
jgi:hypothetical protein